jgi:rhodanese-related sulfurtransferase
MKQMTIVLFLALTSSAFAVETTTTKTITTTTVKTEAQKELKLIKADELQKMNKDAKGSVYVYDVNDNKTRTKEGLIPGATTLTGARDYDVAALPADKKASLVFYCGGPKCMASHDAAKRAIAAGYTNSIVMSDGISGWKKAGFETQKFAN